jgi:hypothetical protein
VAKRGRKPILTPELIAKIQERHRQLVPYQDLRREFGVSIGTISKALKTPWASETTAVTPDAQPPAPTPARTRRSKKSAELAPTDPDAPDFIPADSTDAVELLERQLAVLNKLAKKEQNNASGTIKLGKAINDTIALLAKMTPPPPPDPESSPDMLAAAAAARTKLRELLDRALQEAAPL